MQVVKLTHYPIKILTPEQQALVKLYHKEAKAYHRGKISKEECTLYRAGQRGAPRIRLDDLRTLRGMKIADVPPDRRDEVRAFKHAAYIRQKEQNPEAYYRRYLRTRLNNLHKKRDYLRKNRLEHGMVPLETLEKQNAFLTAFAQIGVISTAAKLSNVPYITIMKWKVSDPEFARRFDEAKIEAVEFLETVARQRAIAGSDRLLVTLLRAYKPEVFAQTVDVRHYLKIEIEKMAAEYGRDPNELMEEVQTFLNNNRSTVR